MRMKRTRKRISRNRVSGKHISRKRIKIGGAGPTPTTGPSEEKDTIYKTLREKCNPPKCNQLLVVQHLEKKKIFSRPKTKYTCREVGPNEFTERIDESKFVELIEYVRTYGLQQEGVFRESGLKTSYTLMIRDILNGCFIGIKNYDGDSVNNVCSAIKLMIREGMGGLVPIDRFINTNFTPSAWAPDDLLSAIISMFDLTDHRQQKKYRFFLQILELYREIANNVQNKMSSKNLAIASGNSISPSKSMDKTQEMLKKFEKLLKWYIAAKVAVHERVAVLMRPKRRSVTPRKLSYKKPPTFYQITNEGPIYGISQHIYEEPEKTSKNPFNNVLEAKAENRERQIKQNNAALTALDQEPANSDSNNSDSNHTPSGSTNPFNNILKAEEYARLIKKYDAALNELKALEEELAISDSNNSDPNNSDSNNSDSNNSDPKANNGIHFEIRKDPVAGPTKINVSNLKTINNRGPWGRRRGRRPVANYSNGGRRKKNSMRHRRRTKRTRTQRRKTRRTRKARRN